MSLMTGLMVVYVTTIFDSCWFNGRLVFWDGWDLLLLLVFSVFHINSYLFISLYEALFRTVDCNCFLLGLLLLLVLIFSYICVFFWLLLIRRWSIILIWDKKNFRSRFRLLQFGVNHGNIILLDHYLLPPFLSNVYFNRILLILCPTTIPILGWWRRGSSNFLNHTPYHLITATATSSIIIFRIWKCPNAPRRATLHHILIRHPLCGA